ncbi:hypothetical protein LTR08_002211 [Meristemomyces frigidus]|nr:hypothetical protein LTR08_002211 [Meristemomyces frigidus]
MKSFSHFTILALVGCSHAFPFSRLLRLGKRQVESQMNDVDILRYALTLEHLEDKFYREGLASFTQADFATAGFDNTFYQNIQTISAHESTHVAFLTAALQSLGEDILTAAGSILTVEARHSAYLRASLSQSPFPQSQDDPLTPDEVHTMAHVFITSCPADNPTFPIKPFPGLSVTTTGTITSGQVIGVQTVDYVLSASDADAHLYAAFITAAGADFALLTPSGDGRNYMVRVPLGVNGQSYLLFTNCNTTVTDQNVVAGPTFVGVSNLWI